ncbi:hypothetical protein ONS95_013075 [Cadophora gregata]|uniref:uncharacterized protein n=1 Tax=Cadophora gregata TaxID=51156 RepID=UPI0026DA8445|nr:uncharacterized protein ONS95_013075 [Cadophora gregata]KAK0100113.1 hypothetical protein ONS96_008047 [Cadophora gregata f. sp. sojae]KAK0100934.1 hypothetical protein ONS96_006167 [Cadophora gregata f. sp. sojae]KAK0113314.1 hypothetical protein ONS96_014179 [Cadophora gregata f. sp. sojae]KAK0116040.1 hypothetical protein ONS95_013075 [Cadophora gregata]
MPHHSSQVSSDLIWEIVGAQNAFLVKRAQSGGVRFSRDPLNLVNKHSRKHAGFVNEKAVGIQAAEGDKGGVTLVTKKQQHAQKPGAAAHKTTFGGNKTTRKTYKAIVSSTAKSGYRPDLRAPAVARASAIRFSQRPKKDIPESKVRGAKAKKAAAAKDE